MKIEEVLHLFTKVSEDLPKKEEATDVICNYKGKQIKERAYYTTQIGRGYWIFQGCHYSGERPEVTHYLDLSKLTTKGRAIELAYNIGCDVLADRALGKKITSTNDVGQLVIDNKHKL
jgi:hypothetical protein